MTTYFLQNFSSCGQLRNYWGIGTDPRTRRERLETVLKAHCMLKHCRITFENDSVLVAIETGAFTNFQGVQSHLKTTYGMHLVKRE